MKSSLVSLPKTIFTARTVETLESAEISFIGRIGSDFFSCDKHLISGVTLRISFLGNRPECSSNYDNETHDYQIEIIQVSLYVRQLTVSDNVYSAIEIQLTKSPALCRYTEIIPKRFLVSTRVQS